MTIINQQLIDARISPITGTVTVASSAGNNRYVLVEYIANDTNHGDIVALLDGVAARVAYPLTRSTDGTKYAASYYWLDSDLPVSAGDYTLTLTFPLVTVAAGTAVYYCEDVVQTSPEVVNYTEYTANTGDFETTISPDASADVFDAFISNDTQAVTYTQDTGQTLLYQGALVNSTVLTGFSYADGTGEATWKWTRSATTGKAYYHLVVSLAPDAPLTTTATISGTVVSNLTETNVVTGGSTLIIGLNNDTFVAAGTGPIGSTADTQALIDGITAATAEATGWNAEVRDKEATTSVSRTSDTEAIITFSDSAFYDITADEVVTVTVPAAVLTSAAPVVASPTFTVEHFSDSVTFNASGAVSLSGLDYVLLNGYDLGVTTIIATSDGGGITDGSGNITIELTNFDVSVGTELMLVIGDWTTAPTATSTAAVCYAAAN